MLDSGSNGPVHLSVLSVENLSVSPTGRPEETRMWGLGCLWRTVPFNNHPQDISVYMPVLGAMATEQCPLWKSLHNNLAHGKWSMGNVGSLLEALWVARDGWLTGPRLRKSG